MEKIKKILKIKTILPVVLTLFIATISFGDAGGKKIIAVVGKKVNSKLQVAQVPKESKNTTQVVQNTNSEEQNLLFKGKVEKAIDKIEKEDKKAKIKGIWELHQLVFKDVKGEDIKIAIPAVKRFVQDEFKKGGGYEMQEAMALLVLISDEEAIDVLNEISKSGPSVKGWGEMAELTDAGYAKSCLRLLEAKKKFLRETQNMELEQKVKLLINELKPVHSPPYDKYIKYKLGMNTKLFLIRIGKPAVPYLVEALEEVMEIEKRRDLGSMEKKPYNFIPIIYTIPEILAEIGDERAIPVLEKMLKTYYDVGSRQKVILEAIKKIKSR